MCLYFLYVYTVNYEKMLGENYISMFPVSQLQAEQESIRLLTKSNLLSQQLVTNLLKMLTDMRDGTDRNIKAPRAISNIVIKKVTGNLHKA